ncbi:MAG: alpha/beta hydrolase [Burkholderiaceae bacterium]
MGTELFAHRWPATTPRRRGGIYLLHGFGEHGARYGALATHLAGLGWEVASHDHRGHGRSPGRHRLLREASWADEASDRFRAFAREIEGPTLLFGHSMGGVVAAEMVLQRHLAVDGLILSSPGFQPMLTRTQQRQLRLMRRLAPRLVMSRPVDGARLSHDPQQVTAYRTDPLVHGRVSAGLVDWMQRCGARSIELADQLEVDTLLLVGGADRVVDPAASLAFARRAPADRLTLHCYDEGLHELFNEMPSIRDRVLADLDVWLAGHFAASAGAAAKPEFSLGNPLT